MKKFLLIFLVLALFFSCQKKSEKLKDEKECVELKTIFSQTDRLEKILLISPFEKEATQDLLDSITSGMQQNLSKGKPECLFTNQLAIPLEVRFEFVQPLSDKTISAEFPEGLPFLHKISQLFSADKEITEFFGEEFARIASHAPVAFLNYFNSDPGVQKNLSQATRWNGVDREKTAEKFSALEGGAALSKIILNSN